MPRRFGPRWWAMLAAAVVLLVGCAGVGSAVYTDHEPGAWWLVFFIGLVGVLVLNPIWWILFRRSGR